MMYQEKNKWIATGLTDVMTCLHQMKDTGVISVEPILDSDRTPCGFKMRCGDGVVGYEFRINLALENDEDRFYWSARASGHERMPRMRDWTAGIQSHGSGNSLLEEYKFQVYQQLGIPVSSEEVKDSCQEE